MRFQPRTRGAHRLPVGSAFRPEVERAVQREMARFDVSRSFVIATAVAHALGVAEQERYTEGAPRVVRLEPRRRRTA